MNTLRNKASAALIVLAAGLIWGGLSQAAVLDEPAGTDPLLILLATELDVAGIDVASNLNAREVIRQRIERPRLGRFPDLPGNTLINSAELSVWESEFGSGQEIGALAIILIENDALTKLDETFTESEYSQFLQQWLQSSDQSRYFVSFHISDLTAARALATAARDHHLQVVELGPDTSTEQAARLYATASQRLAIDSRRARSYRSEITEFSYLGERVRRNTNSLFRDGKNTGGRQLARNEPSVFLKETLGDEFTRSTVREIIVPGGVALGETAALPNVITSMGFDGLQLLLLDDKLQHWTLPAMETASLKALFDFVNRSESILSDAIVDIDEAGRVKISSALLDTDPGYAILQADTQPFEYVDNLNVVKSVIVDVQVAWRPAAAGARLDFVTDFEVRFLSADNMRLAQTRAALEYQYESANDQVNYQDSWGRDAARLTDKVDFAGLGSSVVDVARFAGWVALFRNLADQKVRFLDGRYEFLKIDKSGTPTPRRI